jgi:hypothetical protein
MPSIFLYFYLFALAFYGVEIKGLGNGLFYTNEIMVILSLCFLTITFVEFVQNRSKIIGAGHSEFLLFLFLVWSAGTFYYSVNSDLSLFPVMKSLGGIAFGLGLFLYLKSRIQLNQIWLLSFVFSGIHAGSGIIQKFFPFFMPEISLPFLNAQSTFVSPNFYSCYLLIHVPIGLYLYFEENRNFIKILTGISWISILVALGFSNSLAAQLIAGMQLLSIVIYFGVLKNYKIVKIVSCASMMAIIIYWGLYQLVGDIKQVSFSTPNQTSSFTHNVELVSWYDEHVLSRMVYMWGGWKIFMEHWLTGSGLWTYRELYPFTGLLEAYPNHRLFILEPQHAHSFYFQTAGETGIIGIILLGGNIFYLLWNNIKKLVRERSNSIDIQFFLLISVFGFLIHNIAEYNWLNSHFVYYYTLLIVSLGFLERERILEGQKKLIPVKNLFLVTTILVSIIIIGWSAINYKNYNEIIFGKILASQSYVEIKKVLTRAKKICERCGMPHYLLGIAHIEEARKVKKFDNLKLVKKAEREFSEVLVRNPYSSSTYLAHGDVSSLLGRKKKAIESYQMAMRDLKYKELAFQRIENLTKTE